MGNRQDLREGGRETGRSILMTSINISIQLQKFNSLKKVEKTHTNIDTTAKYILRILTFQQTTLNVL